MKKLELWMRSHYLVTACVMTAISTAALTASILYVMLSEAMGDKPEWIDTALMVGLSIAIITIWVQMKKLHKPIAIILAASLFFNPQAAKAVPLLCLAGAVVLIIGGAVGCQIVKKGREVAKRREAQLTNEERQVSSAGLFTWYEEGDCYEQRLLPSTPTVFTLNILIESKTNCTTKFVAEVGEQYTESFDEFKGELPMIGLSWPESAQPSSCFSFNGQPCAQEDVGLYINTETRTISSGPFDTTVIIERSIDLEHWEQLISFNAAIGEEKNVFDIGCDGMAFYRIKMTP